MLYSIYSLEYRASKFKGYGNNRIEHAYYFNESLEDAEMHLQTIQRIENITPQQGKQ